MSRVFNLKKFFKRASGRIASTSLVRPSPTAARQLRQQRVSSTHRWRVRRRRLRKQASLSTPMRSPARSLAPAPIQICSSTANKSASR